MPSTTHSRIPQPVSKDRPSRQLPFAHSSLPRLLPFKTHQLSGNVLMKKSPLYSLPSVASLQTDDSSSQSKLKEGVTEILRKTTRGRSAARLRPSKRGFQFSTPTFLPPRLGRLQSEKLSQHPNILRPDLKSAR